MDSTSLPADMAIRVIRHGISRSTFGGSVGRESEPCIWYLMRTASVPVGRSLSGIATRRNRASGCATHVRQLYTPIQ